MARTKILRSLGLLRLSSPEIVDGDPVLPRHTAEGGNRSPELSWSEPRAGTASFAVTFEDLRGLHGAPFTLWIVYNIPGSLRALPDGLSKVPQPTEVPGALQGLNDTGAIGYDGPAPPPGHPLHRYLFTIHSLDRVLELPPGITRAVLEKAIEGHVLETGTLLGTCRR
jgi:Raf kinase inhibitor-like YbhB/YbcL family protein